MLIGRYDVSKAFIKARDHEIAPARNQLLIAVEKEIKSSNKLIELSTCKSKAIKKLGYRNLGHLMIKTIDIFKTFENEYIIIFTVINNFDYSKLPKKDADMFVDLFMNLFKEEARKRI